MMRDEVCSVYTWKKRCERVAQTREMASENEDVGTGRLITVRADSTLSRHALYSPYSTHTHTQRSSERGVQTQCMYLVEVLLSLFPESPEFDSLGSRGVIMCHRANVDPAKANSSHQQSNEPSNSPPYHIHHLGSFVWG